MAMCGSKGHLRLQKGFLEDRELGANDKADYRGRMRVGSGGG